MVIGLSREQNDYLNKRQASFHHTKIKTNQMIKLFTSKATFELHESIW